MEVKKQLKKQSAPTGAPSSEQLLSQLIEDAASGDYTVSDATTQGSKISSGTRSVKLDCYSERFKS
jgi:hypothetical protein